ncbi:MAG TPA: phosphatase PAP2 family protein [Nitrososphaeraceae archaeon]|nr:phosphatase PAP2 family protein [Nitrososphaeraceae archaeon]
MSPRADLSLAQMLIAEDTKVFLQVNKYHFALMDQFMILVTQFGRELVWPITIVVLFIFGGDTGKRAAIIMALVMITLIPIGILSKEIVARPRPFIPNTEVILAADSQYAYPSGHSMIVAAGATVALAELYRNSSARMKAVAVALALEASVVCFSRIYVGAHYPLDVLGGILLGAGMSLLFLSQATRIEYLLIMIARPFKRRS